MKRKRKVGIVYDRKKDQAKRTAKEAEKYLESKGCEVFSEKLEEVLKDLDLVITFGGDGLVIHSANKIVLRRLSLPLFRVNFGKIGFLTNVEPEEVFRRIDDFLNNKYIITKRSRISAEVWSEGDRLHPEFKAGALNEVVIERVGTRALSFQVDINGEKIERLGDGLIFSTRTGSTAYNRSVGGPILIKEDRFVLSVISPVVPEKSFYFVRPADSVFRVGKITGDARVVVDGKELLKISKKYLVIIKKSPQSTLFMEFGDI